VEGGATRRRENGLAELAPPGFAGHSGLPVRKRPAHPPPLRAVNRPTLLFVTACVAGRRALLNTPVAHELLVDAWRQAERWLVGRYVVMPDHLHLFCSPGDGVTPFKKWMEYWRSAVTRTWQVEEDKPLWQRDYWDRQLRRGDSYGEKWEYVRNNPVRAGLAARAEEWPYQGELNVLWW
jgi:REP element-mobilizing transposase RayT